MCIGMLSGSMLNGCRAEEKTGGAAPETVQEESEPPKQGEKATDSGETSESEEAGAKNAAESPMIQVNAGELNVIDDNYRTYYEVFLYSFYDSDGDGIGDIQGLIEKLDYINDGDEKTTGDLGFNGIWLMPVMPSTTYHKYDVTDYCDIDPQYGTLEDFKELMKQCRERGINVIIDFVMNHTSSKHTWFTQACEYLANLDGKEPSESECPYFGYYNFSKEQEAGYYYEVPGTDWYYEGKFWSEMPDLNLKNEAVRQELEEAAAFWLELGVDGFRLDAAKEFYSDNTAANVEVLSWFNTAVKEMKEDAYIVAEVWNDAATYAKYYESGIDSVFNFGFANNDGMITSVVKGIAPYTAESYGKAIASLKERFGQYNENYIDAPFYTNHDMGRSAGYYSGEYSEEQTKISAAMNLFMNGSAFVYYGEELGMKGSGKDENKRAPMYWSKDSEAEGMCDGPADMDAVKMKYDSLEEQREDTYSIYNYYKQAVYLRNRYPEIARGTVTYVEDMSDENICVFTKEYQGSEIMILFNLAPEKMAVGLESELTVGGMLITGEEAVVIEESSVVLPPYSVAILK